MLKKTLVGKSAALLACVLVAFATVLTAQAKSALEPPAQKEGPTTVAAAVTRGNVEIVLPRDSAENVIVTAEDFLPGFTGDAPLQPGEQYTGRMVIENQSGAAYRIIDCTFTATLRNSRRAVNAAAQQQGLGAAQVEALSDDDWYTLNADYLEKQGWNAGNTTALEAVVNRGDATARPETHATMSTWAYTYYFRHTMYISMDTTRWGLTAGDLENEGGSALDYVNRSAANRRMLASVWGGPVAPGESLRLDNLGLLLSGPGLGNPYMSAEVSFGFTLFLERVADNEASLPAPPSLGGGTMEGIVDSTTSGVADSTTEGTADSDAGGGTNGAVAGSASAAPEFPAAIPPSPVFAPVEEETSTPDVSTPTATPDDDRLGDEEVPAAAPPQGEAKTWALLNLLLTIASVLVALGLPVWCFIKKRGTRTPEAEEEAPEEEEKGHYRLVLLVLCVVCGAASLVCFLLTENVNLQMVMSDRWTVLMFVMFAVQLVLSVFTRRPPEKERREVK